MYVKFLRSDEQNIGFFIFRESVPKILCSIALGGTNSGLKDDSKLSVGVWK